jgi:wyosine [tRNA(Phe)-imidazoG37] synthetase (radical SAM superfamily)
MSALKPFPKIQDHVYGPVLSRRLGLSLGVNLLPTERKVCSFNCGYCQLGWTRSRARTRFPKPDDVAQAVRERLLQLRRERFELDRITFSGNGEPTDHPDFGRIVDAVVQVRDEICPTVWISALTNGAHLDQTEVLRGLGRCDERIVKLDAGNESMFRRLNKPLAGLKLEKVVAGASRLLCVTIQTMFVTGAIDNASEEQVESWIGQLKRIRPSWVQMYTLDRVPADSKLEPVSAMRLMEISMRVAETCCIEPLLIIPE